jgi:hypothetical protein
VLTEPGDGIAHIVGACIRVVAVDWLGNHAPAHQFAAPVRHTLVRAKAFGALVV